MFKTGDEVKVINNEGSPFYSKGDVGVIDTIDSDGDYWLRFTEHNPEIQDAIGDTWCIGGHNIKLTEENK